MPVDWRAVLAIALVAFLATLGVLWTIDPAGSGPGVTVDEHYDVAAGKKMVQAWRAQGWPAFFRRANLRETYGHLTLHPPLGRWILGWVHAAFDPRPLEPALVALGAARLAPALAFGLLVGLTGLVALTAGGREAGVLAALWLALCPRMFGEAHFATLDTFTALTCTAALWALAWATMTEARARYAWAGLCWGLALLTKLHGLLLFAPGTAWILWRYRGRAWVPWSLWACVGALVFFVGWPWLWLDPVANLRTYVGTSTERVTLHTYYLGQVWADRDVPWHYAWAMLLATTPLGTLVLAAAGAVKTARQRPAQPLLLMSALGVVFWLIVFSVPGVPVYDGVRLFDAVFPPVAMLAGVGGSALWQVVMLPGGAKTLARQLLLQRAFVLLLLATQAWSLWFHSPFWLSYYSPLVGGLPGALRLGFEASYWGDSIDSALLRTTGKLAPGQTVILAPNLAPFQALSMVAQSPALASAEIELVGWDPRRPGAAESARWAIIYRRRAEDRVWCPLVSEGQTVAEVQVAGEWLSKLVKLAGPVSELRPVEPITPSGGGVSP